jgi:hypothetical protein
VSAGPTGAALSGKGPPSPLKTVLPLDAQHSACPRTNLWPPRNTPEKYETVFAAEAASMPLAGGVICNECVELCVQAIGTERPEWLKAHKGFVEQLMKDKAD